MTTLFAKAAAGALLASGLMLSATMPNTTLAAPMLSSGPTRVSVIELFTSQGCSSCPPADRWMSRLLERPRLWQDYVPLAFHVDYWDYIGWKDRFARAEFSDRQRRYADEGGVMIVYTPGFLMNGKEWRHWHSATEPPIDDNLAGELTASIENGTASIRYLPPSAGKRALLASVAVLGFGLESSVVAGENGGRMLRNDFVVLGLNRASLSAGDGEFAAEVRLPDVETAAERYAVVVWVSSTDAQSPLQAAGGWLQK